MTKTGSGLNTACRDYYVRWIDIYGAGHTKAYPTKEKTLEKARERILEKDVSRACVKSRVRCGNKFYLILEKIDGRIIEREYVEGI